MAEVAAVDSGKQWEQGRSEGLKVEATKVFDSVLAMRAPFSHEQYVRLLAICKIYGVLSERDFGAFLDIRDPKRFSGLCGKLRSSLLVKLARVAGLPVPDGLFEDEDFDDVSKRAASVQRGVTAQLPPRG